MSDNKILIETSASKVIMEDSTTVEQKMYNHTHTKSQITDMPTSLKNPTALTVQFNGTTNATYDGSAAKTVNITPASIGAAASSHTHNYAGSSSAGGAATSANKVNKSLTLTINEGTTEGTDKFTFDGSTAKTIDISPDVIGAASESHTHTASDITGVAAASHTHTKSQITDFPTSLKNPTSLTITVGGTDTVYDGSAAKSVAVASASHTHNYAGSSSAGGAANSVANNLAIKLNGGTTEGTNLFTFNGSAAKTVNITAAAIGAAATSHTHSYAGSSSAGGAATSANKVNSSLVITLNEGTTEGTDMFTFNGSAAKTIDISPDTIGAAASSHTHSASDITGVALSDHTHLYAGSSTAGGVATSAAKVTNSMVVKLNSGTTEGTNLFTFNGSAAKTVNITAAAIGAAATSHTHSYAGSSSAGGAATSANKVNSNLVITLNGGVTEGTDKFTFNGSAAKTIDISPDVIGAAEESHTHTKANITDFAHTHAVADITGNIPASKISGVLSIDNIPAAALERVVTVADDTARFALTTSDVQLGDTVKVTSTGLMYIVTDQTNLTTEAGYLEYTAGSAASVPWSGVTGKPTTFTPSTHTHNYAGSTSAGGAANSVANSMVVKLNSGTTEGTNMFTFNGSAAKTVNITPSAIGAAATSHTHNYAGSSSAGGAATSANKVNSSLVVTLNGGETEGTDKFTFNGSAAKTIDITADMIGGAAASHTHTKAEITDFPTSLKNPTSLTIKLNSGTTEGTNLFTYDGSTVKSVNITASSIGAAATSHTHSYAGSSSAGGAANSVANSMIVKLNSGTTEGTNLFTFNGSAAKTVNITASSIGAAATSHTHNYAGSSSAGGAATNVNGTLTNPTTGTGYYIPFHANATTGSKSLLNNSGVALNLLSGTTSTEGYSTLNLGNNIASGTANNETGKVGLYSATGSRVVITPESAGTSDDVYILNLPAANGTLALAGDAASSVANNMVVKLNGGTTEGTNLFTYNGSAAKTVNITASSIGAAATSHTHSYAGSSSAGGAANSVANSMVVKLNGGTTEGTNMFTFNGSAAKSVNITAAAIGAAATSHTHNYAGSSSAGGAATSANKVANALTISVDGTDTVYDGSAVKSVSVAAASHTHSYAGSSSAGGAANSVANSLVVKLNSGTTEGTNLFTFNGSAAKSVNITAAAIGAAASSHTHSYAGSSSAGGAATSANKVNSSLVVTLNGGETEGTDMFTFNGSAAKNIDITASSIGAAASSHTHSYAGSSSAGGAATSANQLHTTTVQAAGLTETTYYPTFVTTNSTSGKNASYWDDTTLSVTIYKAGSLSVSEGRTILTLGNNKSSSTSGNTTGSIRLYSAYTSYIDIKPASTSTACTLTLPAKTGTVALLDDIGSADTLTTSRTIDGVSFNGSANITHYGTCSTSATTAAKVVACTGFVLAAGARISVKFSYTNSNTTPTLNVNNTGAKSISYNNSTTLSDAGMLASGSVITFIYDGTNYIIDSPTISHCSILSEVSKTTSNGNYSLLGANILNGTTIGGYSSLYADTNAKTYFNPSTGTIGCSILTTTGNATIGGVITQTSDRRLKEDFEELTENFIDAYNEINITAFRFKGHSDIDPKAIGVIAQDVIKAFKNHGIDAEEYGIVREDKDGIYSINYEHLDSLSIMVNHAQQKQIEVLNDTIVKMEERLQALEALLLK